MEQDFQAVASVSSNERQFVFISEVYPICFPLLGVQQDLSHPNYARHKLHEQDTSILLLDVAWYVTYSLVNITVSYREYYSNKRAFALPWAGYPIYNCFFKV